MKSRLLPTLALTGLLLPLAIRAEIVRNIEKTFHVEPAGSLKVETFGGAIHVDSADTNEVKVVAKLRFRASTENEADEIAKDLKISIEQQGNEISAVAEQSKLHLLDWGKQSRVGVDFTVTVPKRFDGNLKTSGGTIVVGDLTGEIKARTSGGDIKLSKISGLVDAATSGGTISLKEGTGKTVLKSSGGDLRVDIAGAETELNTSGGNIVVGRADDSLSAVTSGGNITANFVGSLKGESELRTSGGNVKATVEPTSGFRLDAATSGGSVSISGLALSSEKSNKPKTHVEGIVNGGGPLLKLRTSGGNVNVAAK